MQRLDNIRQREYYGLLLGKNYCSLPTEFATKAIDVDLSHYDIRPFKCPEQVCSVDGEYLGYVSDGCCKGEYYYVHDCGKITAIENGIISCADSICGEHNKLAAPIVTSYATPDYATPEFNCKCDDKSYRVRLAKKNCRGNYGLLSNEFQITENKLHTIPDGHVVFAFIEAEKGQNGGWFCQGEKPKEIKPTVEGIYSEGWCNPPEGTKYLVKHKSGPLMCAKGNTIHISHPYYHHLWDKYKMIIDRPIISLKEINGDVFIFDGKNVYIVVQQQVGFSTNIIEQNICIKSHKSLATYNGTIFAATSDGIKSVASQNYRRSSFGYVDEDLMNPIFMQGMADDWKIGVFNSRIHFSNSERAFIYDLTNNGGKRALVESSLVPDDYYSDCDAIYYLVGGIVYRWNSGSYSCDYEYCTNRTSLEECDNIGAITVEGKEFGDNRTHASVKYYDCLDQREVCNQKVCFCDPMAITGCENTKHISVCFKGTDIICNHEFTKSLMEAR